MQNIWRKKCRGSWWDTHIKSVKEVVSRFFVLQEEIKVLKNLKWYTGKQKCFYYVSTKPDVSLLY